MSPKTLSSKGLLQALEESATTMSASGAPYSRAVLDTSASPSAELTAMIRTGCRFLALGASLPASRMRSIFASSTGASLYFLEEYLPSANSMKVIGHRISTIRFLNGPVEGQG